MQTAHRLSKENQRDPFYDAQIELMDVGTIVANEVAVATNMAESGATPDA